MPFQASNVFVSVGPDTLLMQTVAADAHAGSRTAASKPMTTRMIARRPRRIIDVPIAAGRGVCRVALVYRRAGCGDDWNEWCDEQNDTAFPLAAYCKERAIVRIPNISLGAPLRLRVQASAGG